MITPLPCELVLYHWVGNGTIVVRPGKRTIIHGDAKTVRLKIVSEDDANGDCVESLITLCRDQAQKLADDINFLLG